ncbi:MAG: carbohydrate kinase, partial [Clostridia bacterium]|nr:carbohydrate kinase [Clostridia bacterium]
MILSIGEILADIVNVSGQDYKVNLGGAPFNMAVSAKNNGAKVGFIGAVGKDVVGRELNAQAKLYGLDYLNLQSLNSNTTLAFVTLNNGERDFSFFRDNTADFKIDYKDINLSTFKDLSILHLGSLMLSESLGQKAFKNLVKKAKKIGVKISFDVNLRDIFKSIQQTKKAYSYALNNCDIIKLSQEELEFFTGEGDLIVAINSFARQNVLYVVTQGENGSLCYYNGKAYSCPSVKVSPIDTTGAGDAFYGAFLAEIENKEYTEQVLTSALKKANKVGAEATLYYGALVKKD